MRHRRRDITFLKDVNKNLGKENYSRSTSLHSEEVQLMSQASSGISFTSIADKQKKPFENKTKSRNTDNSDDSVSSNDESDSPDSDSSNGKYTKKKSKKSEREEKRDRFQTYSTQKCEQLYGKYYPDEMR